jgi:hypothetical protein
MNWKGAPITTKMELQYMELVRALPCACCGFTPVILHHIKEGGNRLGHRFVLPLCTLHHVGNEMSVHRTHRTFVATFGTERELWNEVQCKLGLPTTGWPESKILPRRAEGGG